MKLVLIIIIIVILLFLLSKSNMNEYEIQKQKLINSFCTFNDIVPNNDISAAQKKWKEGDQSWRKVWTFPYVNTNKFGSCIFIDKVDTLPDVIGITKNKETSEDYPCPIQERYSTHKEKFSQTEDHGDFLDPDATFLSVTTNESCPPQLDGCVTNQTRPTLHTQGKDVRFDSYDPLEVDGNCCRNGTVYTAQGLTTNKLCLTRLPTAFLGEDQVSKMPFPSELPPEDPLDVPAKTTRRRIIERAIGWVVQRIPWTLYGCKEYNEMGEPVTDSKGKQKQSCAICDDACASNLPGRQDDICSINRQPIETCSTQENMPGFRPHDKPCPYFGDNRSNSDWHSSNAQCCGMIWNSWQDFNGLSAKDLGYCGGGGGKTSYPIDIEDALPGDLIVHRSKSNESGECKNRRYGYSGNSCNGNHIMIFRRIMSWGRDEHGEFALCKIYQIGGGGGTGNVSSTKVYKDTFSHKDNTRVVFRRRNIVNEDGSWELDGYRENRRDHHGTKISKWHKLHIDSGGQNILDVADPKTGGEPYVK